MKFKEPFGTLTPGQSCRMCVHIPALCRTREVFLVLLSENGAEYKRHKMSLAGADVGYEFYGASFSLPEAGLFFYYFRIRTENEEFSLYRYGFDQTNMEAGELWQLSCVPESFHTPEAFYGSVMYQIFPDRFYADGILPAEGKLTPYWIHENKTDIPAFEPDENGEVKNCDFYGGNLRGIAQKLDYLKALGVSVLYLNPIFKAYSNHRYDTSDYMKIDELLGDEADFSRLCGLAHERGMRIILDGVFSHTGSNSRYFDVYDIYGDGAYRHADSKYRSWYDFEEYPEKYKSWWGISTLPCVNEMDDSYREYIFGGDDSVVAHWLRAGADGFRLDVADELPDEFISQLRARLKEIKPEALLIGEVWEDASNKISYGLRRRYFTGGELDSVMNYPLRKAIIEYVCGLDEGYGLRRTVMDLAENYPHQVMHTVMNMLSTHDTPRLLSALSPSGAPENKRERAGYRMSAQDMEIARSRLYCAVFLQFMLPGMPCVYYGDELGTEGAEDPFCRGYFDWERTDGNPVLGFFRTLAGLRNENDALKTGSVIVESDGAGRVTVERRGSGELLRAFVNVGEPTTAEISGTVLLSEKCEVENGSMRVENYGFFVEKRTDL
ncbi:MAG: glycoside hydrolase family 13 protein [Oscillospiraceae bacterium]|nr:glycoside hydrolase family 13 protein [Oscillospiraceae bacterium]